MNMPKSHFKTQLTPDGCVKTLLKILTYQTTYAPLFRRVLPCPRARSEALKWLLLFSRVGKEWGLPRVQIPRNNLQPAVRESP
jgi:hypothetical protein